MAEKALNITSTPQDKKDLAQLFQGDMRSSHDAHAWAQERLRTYSLENDRYFRAMVHVPKKTNGNIILVTSEYANGEGHTGGIPRLRTIGLADPHAVMIWQLNDTVREQNLNFTRKEIAQVGKGDFEPYADRINTIIAGVRNETKMDNGSILALGPSAGGPVLGGVAPRLEAENLGCVFMDSPNVVKRSMAQLAFDFLGGSGELMQVIEANYTGYDTSMFEDIRREHSLRTLARFGISGLLPSNIAAVKAMRRPTLSGQISEILNHGGSVVHSWGDNSRVSPASENQKIRNLYIPNPRYSAHEAPGDHSMTNRNLLALALTRRACELMELAT